MPDDALAGVVWDQSSSNLKKLLGHDFDVQDVAWNTKGTQLASCSSDDTIIIWDCVGWKKVSKLLGHKGMVNTVEFSPDGRFLVSGSDDETVVS